MWLLIGVIGNDKANYTQAVNVLRWTEIYEITAISQALQAPLLPVGRCINTNGSHGELLFLLGTDTELTDLQLYRSGIVFAGFHW